MKKTILALVIMVIMSVSVMAYGGSGLGVVMPPSVFNELTQLQKDGTTYATQPFPYMKKGEELRWKPQYRNGEIPVREISITTKNNVRNKVFFLISEEDKRPLLDFEFASFSVKTNLDKKDIEKVKMQFDVDIDWIMKNDFDVIELRKDSEDGSTYVFSTRGGDIRIVSRDDKTATLEVEMEGFSTFLIYGYNEGEMLGTEKDFVYTEETFNEKVERDENSYTFFGGGGGVIEQPKEEESNTGLWIAAFVLIVLGIIGICVYANREKPEEQNQIENQQ